ncbi:hypothetical protein G5B37_01435 [Rasiella rasia]|uniref:Polysaccharide export protein n=1 Tax=Rasiella rasia TaxID=2744027 RepID=A0A6G6GI72_9FLAO|nr:polysaccharide biosynthesis/export family protein [Rasiella rasia]QIE58275.1 hypothetical protein G5B37_01435 [Rasiella rasia]
MRNFIIVLLLAFCFFSCATKKEIIYFQDADNLNATETAQYFDPKIEPNDILYISVSALDEEVLKPYRRSIDMQNTVSDNQLQGYLVGSDGTIQYPGLGAISVVGNTRTEVITALTTELSKFVKDIVVDVRIINFKVTVLGEVNNPGVYVIKDERVTIPQAIGLAGDFTADGKRETVTIIREENGSQKVTKVDFTKTEFFSSPYYFLKQNDIVYVEPSLKGVKKSGFIPDIPAVLSVVTIVLSAVILITR